MLTKRQNRDIFSIFCNTKVCIICSNYNRLFKATLLSTHNILFLILKKKVTLNYPKSAAVGFLPRDSKKKKKKNELAIAVVNEPSVFEPLKVYCISR